LPRLGLASNLVCLASASSSLPRPLPCLASVKDIAALPRLCLDLCLDQTALSPSLIPSIPSIIDIKALVMKLCQKMIGVRVFFFRCSVYCVGLWKTQRNIKKTNERDKIHTKNLFHLDFVEVISSPHKGVIGRVFPANHLASTDN